MEKDQKKSGFMQSLAQAGNGLNYAWKTQGHLRFHGFAAVVVLLCAWWLKLSVFKWLILIYAIGSVITAETFNTAIEVTVDLAQPNFHPMAGIAKDVAAGAVVVTAIQAVIIGLIIFIPEIVRVMF